jgi:hypothetical protein
MKVIIVTAFICISTILTYGQQSIRWNEGDQLTWDDFTGKVIDTSKYDAECFAEIRYNYKFYSQHQFEFEVYANFDKNSSWSRKEQQSNALLKHEQMHFNIAELFAGKLRNDFQNFNYSANYSEQIDELFSSRKLQYQAMQRQYDDETNHSLNKDKQKEWEDLISLELQKTKQNLQFADINQIPRKQGI